MLCLLSQLLATPWTVACQAPLSMGLPRQEYWSGLAFPSPGDLPNPGLLHCRWILYHLSHQAHNWWGFFEGLIFYEIILCTECASRDRKTKRWGERPVRGQMMGTWAKAAEAGWARMAEWRIHLEVRTVRTSWWTRYRKWQKGRNQAWFLDFQLGYKRLVIQCNKMSFEREIKSTILSTGLI